MDETTQEAVVTVTNPQGLHARPAEMFVRLASRFTAKVEVVKEGEYGECVDGKSIMGILSLLAEKGSRLSIRATGSDAADALKALADLVQDGFAGETDRN
jgi:phosphotransferase system HPr (HPr) family protein